MKLKPELLLRAYAVGIFPMAESRAESEIHWIDPELRGVLPLDGLYVSKRLRRTLRGRRFEVRADTAFDQVIKGCATPAPDRPPGERAEGEAVPAGAVVAPMVGTAYLAAEPGAPSFVSVGDEVREGQTLLIIEAMKVMNQIPSPRNGRVTRVMVEDGQPVEFGEPLLVIE